MSPEQANGEAEKFDARTDVFGLGAVLCEVLTGSPPYTSETRPEILQNAATGDVTDAFARLDASRADAELIVLAKDCLSPERERRPQDAGAVAARLATYLTGVREQLRKVELKRAAAQARAEEARAKVRAERRARRLTVGLAFAVLAVLASVTVGGLWFQRQQAQETQQAEVLRRDVGALLAQSIGFRQSAHFEESRELLEQAQQRLGIAGPPDLREQVVQALADTGLAKRLDAARQRVLTVVEGKHLDFARAETEYAAALMEAGLGQESEDPENVAARVRASGVRAELQAALENWAAMTADRSRQAWLLAVVRATDPDPEGDRLRQPSLWQDGAAIARLAEKSEVAALSPQLAAALGQAQLMNGGDAVRLLGEAVAHYPNDFWLNFNMAVALNRANQSDDAIGYYRAALALRPHAPAVHNNLGYTLRQRDKLDEAISHLEHAVRFDPQYADAHYNLGLALYAKGRRDGAIGHYQEALRLNPNDAPAHNNLGEALYAEGRQDEAIGHYQEALRINGKYAIAHNNLGAALCDKNRLDEGIDHFREALRINPKFAAAHSNFGAALYDKGRWDEAVGHYEVALRIDPKDAPAHYNLADALRDKGRLGEAIGHYQEALRINSNSAKIHNNLAIALCIEGRLDQAIGHYEECIKIDPKDAQALGNLGQAFIGLGRFVEAGDATRNCLDLLPQGHPRRPAMMQQLQRCDRSMVMEARLPAVLRGEDNTTRATEWLEFAWISMVTKQFAAAVPLYCKAFAVDPKQADDMRSGHRWNAACCASLAAAALKDNEKEQHRLRRQALDWLRADLAFWEKQAETGNAMTCAMAQQTLWVWQNNPSFAGVRDTEWLAKLPCMEREAWEKLWAEVEALRKRASETK
jgi:tetratricopeptide (TPR) repeat protein